MSLDNIKDWNDLWIDPATKTIETVVLDGWRNCIPDSNPNKEKLITQADIESYLCFRVNKSTQHLEKTGGHPEDVQSRLLGRVEAVKNEMLKAQQGVFAPGQEQKPKVLALSYNIIGKGDTINGVTFHTFMGDNITSSASNRVMCFTNQQGNLKLAQEHQYPGSGKLDTVIFRWTMEFAQESGSLQNQTYLFIGLKNGKPITVNAGEEMQVPKEFADKVLLHTHQIGVQREQHIVTHDLMKPSSRLAGMVLSEKSHAFSFPVPIMVQTPSLEQVVQALYQPSVIDDFKKLL